jgi:hypothetical protein
MKMKKKLGMSLSLLLFGKLALASNGGDLISLKRCKVWGDSLSNEQAQQRVQWGKKCAIDQVEKILLQFNKTLVLPDGSRRIAYPIYGVPNSDTTKPSSNPAKWFAPVNGAAACEGRPAGYTIIGICAASCYTMDQLIMTEEGMLEVASAMEKDVKVEVLEDVSEKGMGYKLASVENYIESIIAGKHEIVVFETEKGKKVSVTTEHPFVDGSGAFIAANDIKVGTMLMAADGSVEKVISRKDTVYEGKVYNLHINTENLNNKIINAQGLMSGDVTVQNSNLKKLNQMLYRLKFIPRELLK